MERLDYITDNDNDLLIQNGDFVIDNGSLLQAISILRASKGEFTFSPLLGAELDQIIGTKLDENILFNLCKDELKKDGIILKNIEIDSTFTDYQIKLDIL